MNHMNRVERDQMIEEAAALPVGDPMRQELVRRIDADGDGTRREWTERSASYETIRERLRDVAPPADMVEGLLLIPSGLSAPGRPARRAGTHGSKSRGTTQQRRWTYAAVLAMAVTSVIGLWLLRTPSPHHPVAGADPFGDLVALMIADHAKRPALVIESSDPREIEQHLMTAEGSKNAPALLVRVPDAPTLGDDFQLQGGRLCKFDTQPIAYTRWAHKGIDHSLYQVEPDRFSLPDTFERTEVLADGHRVVLWHDDGMAYGLVCPD